jgi:hypothetical protein
MVHNSMAEPIQAQCCYRYRTLASCQDEPSVANSRTSQQQHPTCKQTWRKVALAPRADQGCTKRVFADYVNVLNAVPNAVNETLSGERWLHYGGHQDPKQA